MQPDVLTVPQKLNKMAVKYNTKIILEYDGTNYSGWQRLNHTGNKDSIQSVLEKTITDYLKEEIKVIGSGRTDAGVHALGQTANFYSKNQVEPITFIKDLNSRLPQDIRIHSAGAVSLDFHSRYLAKSKMYEYRIDTGEVPCVFTRKYTCHIPDELNIKAMEQAAAYLIGTHDFKSFTSDKNLKKSTVRTIESINIYRHISESKSNRITFGSNELRIDVTGDGFLYNMVRIIIGTLLEVGNGLREPKEIIKILEGKNRQLAGKTVSSHALLLHHVDY